MAKIENIIIHCSDSSFGSAALIRQWHLERGWRDIGYHFVILNGEVKKGFRLLSLEGSIEVGRPIDSDNYLDMTETGAHTLGYNRNSIGICLIGSGDNDFTNNQLIALKRLVQELREKFDIPLANVIGHYETENANGKTCPNFDMELFRSYLEKMEYVKERLAS